MAVKHLSRPVPWGPVGATGACGCPAAGEKGSGTGRQFLSVLRLGYPAVSWLKKKKKSRSISLHELEFLKTCTGSDLSRVSIPRSGQEGPDGAFPFRPSPRGLGGHCWCCCSVTRLGEVTGGNKLGMSL